MDKVAIAINEVAKVIEKLKIGDPSLLDWLTTIFSGAIAVAAIVGIIKIIIEFKTQKQAFIEAQNVRERELIQRKLNFFFGPLKALRSESKVMYDHFALKEKDEIKMRISSGESIKPFRTLRHLSQGGCFKDQDSAILQDILEIGCKQLNLLEKEGHVVNNSQLADLLGKLGAHIRFLVLAADYKLKGMSRELEEVVFPKEVDGALESETRRLQDQYAILKNPELKKKKIKIIPPELRDSVAYYDNNHKSYFRVTAHIDLADEYKRFLDKLSVSSYSGLILDAGCGVGRDTRYFIKGGYRVVSLDASKEMVRICNQYPHAYCIQNTFSSIDYVEEFDGIWACASLIHLPMDEFNDALCRFVYATKDEGIIYFSLKEGVGKENCDGKNTFYHIDNDRKTTYYHDHNDVQDIMKKELMCEMVDYWESNTKKHGDDSIWRNYIFKKPKKSDT